MEFKEPTLEQIEISEKVNFFFNISSPFEVTTTVTQISPLASLHQGVELLLKNKKGLLLATMGMMSGIELAGKFFTGKDGGGTSSLNFRDYAVQFMGGLEKENVEALYQLRCSMTHSFGLRSEPKNEVFKFCLSEGPGGELIQRENDTYFISADTLWILFHDSLSAFKHSILAELFGQTPSSGLVENFVKMFGVYGKTNVWNWE